MAMCVSNAGLSLVQAWEGLVDGDPSTVLLDPYICPAGVFTVGWGHALTTPAGVQITVARFGRVQGAALAKAAMLREFGKAAISREEALACLEKDMASAEEFVNHKIVADTTQGEFDAMCAFTFNAGVGSFQSSSILRLHNAGKRATGQHTIAELAAFSKTPHAEPLDMPESYAAWSHGGGKWLLGLFRRRVSECMVYAGRDGADAYRIAMAFHD